MWLVEAEWERSRNGSKRQIFLCVFFLENLKSMLTTGSRIYVSKSGVRECAIYFSKPLIARPVHLRHIYSGRHGLEIL
jgi:hypothetical protein